jgi:cyclophilin family peptidyl-prolyl cis-trans isomerase
VFLGISNILSNLQKPLFHGHADLINHFRNFICDDLFLIKDFARHRNHAIFSAIFMNTQSLITAISAFILGGSSLASAAAPQAPSDFKVKAIGVNAFQLTWKDNSDNTAANPDNELGWQVLVALKGSKPQAFRSFPGPGLTSYTMTTNSTAGDIAGKELDFQLVAYNIKGPVVILSKATPIVSVRVPSSDTFGTPTKLKATAINDGQIQLSWKDNSTSEHAYELQYRIGASKKWLTPQNYLPGSKFKFKTDRFIGAENGQLKILNEILPATTYSFRVRGLKESPTTPTSPIKFTGFSKIVKVTTKPFLPPSELVATPEGEGVFSFKWKDNSSYESGFEFQTKVGTRDFASEGTLPANSTSLNTLTGFPLNTDCQFRMRSFRQIGTTRVYSEFSTITLAKSSTLKTPTNLLVTSSTDNSVTLTWKDESARENRYEIEYRAVGATDFVKAPQVNSSPRVITTTPLTSTVRNLAPGTPYEFRIHALEILGLAVAQSADTALVRTTTKDAIIGDLKPPTPAGNQFNYVVQVSRPSELTSTEVTKLPTGLTYNSNTRTISGIPSNAGTYLVSLKATFIDGTISTRALTLTSTASGPIISQAFAAANVAIGASSVVSATGKFSDPDSQSAARVTTTSGVFDIIFYPSVTPLTVDNFIDYMDAMKYDDTFFHRAPAGFVLQGGGYKHTTADGYRRVVTFPTVNNEPGISNVRGTVAMAKLGTDPNSATSQFFVNLGDNSANLDAQNGGFTVFGRVPASGMTVINLIRALPIRNYSITTDFGVESLGDVPTIDVTTAPPTLNPAKLVKITSTGPAPILTYQVLSAQPTIATATVTGTDITITGVAAGSTTIQVTATDLDGLTVIQNISVTVP